MQRHNVSTKPEYVLKRANDLIKTAYGNNADREKLLALEQLHNVISNKRKGVSWTKTHEEVMKRHIELCVDLKDHRLVKDGLHQYRNLCQNIEPISLEHVINHLIEISESRANEARSKANKVALAAAAKVADLEQEESPESILLSSMTEEASKHRTDREVVVPWLKFLWETYRTILELLHKNPKYDRLYHKTCEKAFKFCEDYKRTLEFRRLCDMLRTHLSNLQKLTVTTTKTNKVVFEWTQEIIDLHLKTRLEQLEVATVLEQWNEGFRIVEDIYAIMTTGKKTPKPRVMALYYEKLTRIFWVSENYLFHAYAWFKYYCLVFEYKKEIKPDDRALLASHVLLSALIISSNELDGATLMNVDVDDNILEKNQQMAMLLEFQANPTRQNLLANIVAKGIHREVHPDLASLYGILEVDFKPLEIPTLIDPILKNIGSHPVLHMYAVPLQQVAVLRVVQQLSKVYGAIKISRFQSILRPFSSMSYTQVEKLMIDCVVKKQLNVRIDHVNHCLKFGSIVAATQMLETHLVHAGINLNKSVFALNNCCKTEESESREANLRKLYLQMCVNSSHESYLKSSERKELINELKEAIELSQQRKEEYDRLRKEEIERQRLDEMKRQLDDERDAREKQRQLQEDLKRECERLAAEIETYNSTADVEDLLKLDANARQAVLTKAKSDYLKFREAQLRKLAEQAKRLDFITRAQRLEAAKVIKENYEKQMKLDRITFNERLRKLIEEARKEHSLDLEEKKRFSKMQLFRSKFEREFIRQQRAEFELYIEEERSQAWHSYHLDKILHARRLRQNELERQRLEEDLERQRIAKEESDRLAKEQDEKLRKARAEEEALQREKESESERRRAKAYIPPSRQSSTPATSLISKNEPESWRQPQSQSELAEKVNSESNLKSGVAIQSRSGFERISSNSSVIESEPTSWRRSAANQTSVTVATNSFAREDKNLASQKPGLYVPPRATDPENSSRLGKMGSVKTTDNSEVRGFSKDTKGFSDRGAFGSRSNDRTTYNERPRFGKADENNASSGFKDRVKTDSRRDSSNGGADSDRWTRASK